MLNKSAENQTLMWTQCEQYLQIIELHDLFQIYYIFSFILYLLYISQSLQVMRSSDLKPFIIFIRPPPPPPAASQQRLPARLTRGGKKHKVCLSSS